MSPDGKLIACAAEGWPALFLFNADTGERIFPSNGHASRINHLFVHSGGKTLRTICKEQHVCTWEADTLRLVGKVIVPPHLRIEPRYPPDGKVLICQDLLCDKEVRLVVVDSDTGKPLRSLGLKCPPEQEKMTIGALDERRAVAVIGQQLFEFDYRAGKLLRQWICHTKPRSGYSYWTTHDQKFDHNILTTVFADGMGSQIELRRLDLSEGKFAPDRLMKTDGAWTAGFVPGEKALWLSEIEQLRFLDSETLKPTGLRRFRGARLDDVTFTPDGSRFACREERWTRPGDFLGKWEMDSPNLIRVHDRKTLKTLAALPCPSSLSWFRLRPDGKRVAVVSGSSLELWDLSGLDTR